MENFSEEELQRAIQVAKQSDYWKLNLSLPKKIGREDISFLLNENIPCSFLKRTPKLCKMCNKPMGKSKEDLAEMSHAIAFYYCKGHIHLEDKIREEKKKKFTDYWQ